MRACEKLLGMEWVMTVVACLAVVASSASGQRAEQAPLVKTYHIATGNADAIGRILEDTERQTCRVAVFDDNTLLVEATPSGHDVLKLHVSVPRITNDTSEILNLTDADARNVAAIINERLSGIVDAPVVKADARRKAVIIIGTPEGLRTIKAMIKSCLAQGLGTKSGEPITREPKTYHFEFDKVPMGKVLDWLVEITGLPMSGSNRVITGSLAFTPEIGADGHPKQYTVPEIIDELNALWAVSPGQKWIIVRRQTTLGIYPADEPLPINAVKMIDLHDLYSRDFGKTEFVGLKYQLTTGNAERTARAIKAFMGPFGQVVPVAEANQLILVDSVGALRTVIHKIDEFEKAHGG